MAEVPGSSPMDPSFGLVFLYWIYMCCSHSSILTVTLEPYQRYETMAIVGTVCHIWQNRQLFCFKFHSRVVLVHFRLATWQPLIGTRGGFSLGHSSPFQVSMPCHHSMPSLHITHTDCMDCHMAQFDWSTDRSKTPKTM
jgi:hypothetical protein